MHGGFAKVIQSHAVRDESIIVRPHGSAVIAERIENLFIARHRSPAPTGKHVIAHKTLSHDTGALATNDARE